MRLKILVRTTVLRLLVTSLEILVILRGLMLVRHRRNKQLLTFFLAHSLLVREVVKK